MRELNLVHDSNTKDVLIIQIDSGFSHLFLGFVFTHKRTYIYIYIYTFVNLLLSLKNRSFYDSASLKVFINTIFWPRYKCHRGKSFLSTSIEMEIFLSKFNKILITT